MVPCFRVGEQLQQGSGLPLRLTRTGERVDMNAALGLRVELAQHARTSATNGGPDSSPQVKLARRAIDAGDALRVGIEEVVVGPLSENCMATRGDPGQRAGYVAPLVIARRRFR